MKGTVYGSIRRWVSLLLGLALLAALLPGVCALAEEENGTPEETLFSRAWLCSVPYGYNRDVGVLVMTNDPDAGEITREAVEAEIRYYPFDSEKGLYAWEDGEPAGEKAEVTVHPEIRSYTVSLKVPGKYLLSGEPYYLLDPKEPALAALRKELDGVVRSSLKDREIQTAKALHDWICGRISPVIPEGEQQRAEAFRDPMNALLAGYAGGEAYARLNGMLLNAAGIRCLTVSGTAGEEAASWSLCRTDGEWRWTDAAADDAGDKRNNRYACAEDPVMEKDHILCPEDRAFLDEMIRREPIDGFLDGTLDASILKEYPKDYKNFDYLAQDGPAWVVGDEATLSFRLYSNRQDRYRKMTPEEFLKKNLSYYPFLEEDGYYYIDDASIREDMVRNPEIPALSELVTVDEAAEDLSSFTLTFHVPGEYRFMDECSLSFYLISPEQEAPAAMAKQMDAVVEKAKKAPTEKQAARSLFQWIRGKIRYNMPAWKFMDNLDRLKDWDMQARGDALNALFYGKCVCVGYARIYSILMQQAGLRQLEVDGFILADYEGHVWNLNLLDGEWSYTDPTWNYFCQSREQNDKERENYNGEVQKRVFFGSVFDLLADQAEESIKPLDILPRYLKVLPAEAGDYGFPDIAARAEKEKVQAEILTENGDYTLVLGKKSKIRITGLPGEQNFPRWVRESKEPVNEYEVNNVSPEQGFELEILAYDGMTRLSRPTLNPKVYFKSGKITGNGWRYLVPIDRKAYPDMSEYGWIAYEYDGGLNPKSITWSMMGKKYDHYNIQVFFGPDGKAESYSASCVAQDSEYKWQGTAEQPLTVLQGKEVPDPAAADPLKWEAIWFE